MSRRKVTWVVGEDWEPFNRLTRTISKQKRLVEFDYPGRLQRGDVLRFIDTGEGAIVVDARPSGMALLRRGIGAAGATGHPAGTETYTVSHAVMEEE